MSEQIQSTHVPSWVPYFKPITRFLLAAGIPRCRHLAEAFQFGLLRERLICWIGHMLSLDEFVLTLSTVRICTHPTSRRRNAKTPAAANMRVMLTSTRSGIAVNPPPDVILGM